MLSNPLCLAIQVLALLLGECPMVCTVFPGLARDDDVTSSGWPNEGWFSSSVDDRCWIEEATPPFIIASTWNHRRVTSVPVITSEPLNLQAGAFHGSGLVSSREGSMLSNPLCLAIWVSEIIIRQHKLIVRVRKWKNFRLVLQEIVMGPGSLGLPGNVELQGLPSGSQESCEGVEQQGFCRILKGRTSDQFLTSIYNGYRESSMIYIFGRVYIDCERIRREALLKGLGSGFPSRPIMFWEFRFSRRAGEPNIVGVFNNNVSGQMKLRFDFAMVASIDPDGDVIRIQGVIDGRKFGKFPR
ncbi:hypothetical protein HPB51_025904 [Rhipicephalus microplus]|uniref:Uncharacterized protein n=1 Tax=Rhipicephalus microplus TaxID=6941 RepID=A0A9J6ED88_RHIMP|nr:hypothetical protein HPB51_025904 [Rhipicephalus microplus]